MRHTMGRSAFFFMTLPSMLFLTHCRHADNTSKTLAQEAVTQSPQLAGARISSFVHKVNRRMGHGDRVSVPVDPKRQIAQITPYYSGTYQIPVLKKDGTVAKNDEGATYYKDGMYAFGYLRTAGGTWRPVSVPKFVDQDEHDNWHDLKATNGDQLDIEFRHDERYQNDSLVIAAKRTVDLYEVKVVYADDPNEIFHVENYNPDSEKYAEVPTEIAMAGIQVEPGQSHKLNFDATGKHVYKIVVRWGDAKERRPDGSWNSGMASGSLTINGQEIGQPRNVAFIENQVWDGLNFSGPLEIGVKFVYDIGRVHAIRIYYTPKAGSI